MTQVKSKLNILSTATKLLLSTALVYWTYHKGLWNFAYIAKYLHQPFSLICGFLLIFCALILLALRWKNILSRFN